jgi:hypothetical protein
MNKTLLEILPIDKLFHKEYWHMVDLGKKYIQNKNITIISLARNIGKQANKNITKVYSFLKDHQVDCNWIIFENDSTDNTKQELYDINQNNPKIHIISKNLNRKQYGQVKDIERVKALSEYRNIAKEHAKKVLSDFVIVLDLDFIDISLEGLLNSFGWLATDNNISGVAGNSFEYKQGLTTANPTGYNLWNYDSWAFRNTWWLDLHHAFPAPDNDIDPMLWFGFWIPPTGSRPMKVNSAFGGCCIYRSNIYFLADYDYKDCEHVCFHYNQTFNANNNFLLVLNPSQQMLF